MYQLRSRTFSCKANFKSKYEKETLACQLCDSNEDDQKHILECSEIKEHFKGDKFIIRYNQLFSNIEDQTLFIKVFSELITLRSRLLEEKEESASAPKHYPSMVLTKHTF